MPHRKPLGTTCRTRCRWYHGEPPILGDYLVTPAETHYLIVGISETGNKHVFNLLLERAAEPAGAAIVHPFEWDSRKPR